MIMLFSVEITHISNVPNFEVYVLKASGSIDDIREEAKDSLLAGGDSDNIIVFALYPQTVESHFDLTGVYDLRYKADIYYSLNDEGCDDSGEQRMGLVESSNIPEAKEKVLKDLYLW